MNNEIDANLYIDGDYVCSFNNEEKFQDLVKRIDNHDPEIFKSGMKAHLANKKTGEHFWWKIGEFRTAKKEEHVENNILCSCPTERNWIMNNGCQCGAGVNG